MDDDTRLASDLARDLDAAFERLVVAHQDRLYTIALRMLGDRGAAAAGVDVRAVFLRLTVPLDAPTL